MAMMVGLFEMAEAEVGEAELMAACQDVMAAIDKDGDGEVEFAFPTSSLSKLGDPGGVGEQCNGK